MDVVLSAAFSGLPQLGGAAILGWLLIVILRREGRALEQAEALHTADRVKLLAEIDRLRNLRDQAETRADEAELRADLEMEARRRAQEAAVQRRKEGDDQ